MNTRDYPPQADEADRDLLARAAAEIGRPSFHISKQWIAQQEIDPATAALYLSLRASPVHEPLIRAIEAGCSPDDDEPPTLVIMPGAFHRHHDHTGADGACLLTAAAALGWPCPRVVDVPSLGSLQDNAAALIEHLRRACPPGCGRIVLASLSKGSADVAVALRHPDAPEAFAHVRGWVSLSGLLFGTPLVQWLRRSRLRMAGVHLSLWMKGLRFGPVQELRHDRQTLDTGPPVPSHFRAIHVFGFPLRRHLRHPWAPKGYERLAPLGPNDGGGILLADALRVPGCVYPVWGADHYLKPAWDFSAALRNLLLYAANSPSAASAPAAGQPAPQVNE
ncbi:MAG TPA: hypothetical protein VIL86_19695 [Tepidisphaeraceae bacterium]